MYGNDANSNGSNDGFDYTSPSTRQKPTTCLSITTLIFSILNLILGIGTLAVGVIFLLIFSNLDKNTGLYISVAVFTSLGFFLIFLSILGIVGVSRKNRPVLICFASFLILLLVIRTVMGIVLIAKPDVAMPLVKEACLHFINVINDHSEEPEIVQLASDVGNWYQESKCCGYDGPEDLKNPNETCCISTFNCELTNYSGCKDIIQRAVENLSTTFGGIELGFLPLPIIFVTCVILLIRRL